VVDPGVGGARRPILVRIRDHFFIGPDNGLFWPIISTSNTAAQVPNFLITHPHYG